ncbi:hypothetical protein CAPTEDRAFT_93306 [Capitella teleta]|uniref:Nuclear envelope membrane protein n=1 Tax=Capitella teleta TaxID=283909 RepID=X2BBX4_CAPTE|nr:hypothetical protein CAPTEDRAFT_93306 [Capitella teleta]|eukprot:ELU10145.1 hypothetical protein CAPTEDRAFT_93306 [Capitella teleta]
MEFLSSQSVNSSSLLATGFFGGGCAAPFLAPLLVNLFVMAVFLLQHSLMASVPWKQFIERVHLQPIDRCLYVLATCLTLQWIMSHSTALPGLHLWFLDTRERPWLWLFFCLTHALCWLTIYACALLMDCAELLGVKQVYYHLARDGDDPMDDKAREVQSVYRHMRHPGSLCLLLILWLHPVMSVSRLFLALVLSLYVLFGHRVKQQDCDYLQRQFVKKSQSLKEQFSLLH